MADQIAVEGPRSTPSWKRAFDVVVATAILTATAPVLGVVALVNRVAMGPGVLYRQPRGGLGGDTFDIVKFRTMLDLRDEHGELLVDGDRRHPVGDKLRAWSLDELPTLWNVLVGDMSIVGPRPLMAKYLPRYSERHSHRHDVVPGLTGLAQVKGRNQLSWEEKFELDLDYVERRSIALDVEILVATVRTVLGRQGADGIDHTTEFMGATVIVGSTPVEAEAVRP